MAERRPKIPLLIETKVLTRSKRRCCLCVGLQADFSEKRIQIAHIDHDRNNNKEDNLVALCLIHHDEYDEAKSQSKGITKNELKHYRSELDKVVQKLDEQLKLPNSNSSKSENSFATPSAKLIGQILEAFDKEALALESNNKPTGIALARLSHVALTEEGDFDAVSEGLMFLVRLYYLEREKELQAHVYEHPSGRLTDKMSSLLPVSEKLPSVNVVKSVCRVLNDVANLDFSLFHKIVERTKKYSYIGEQDFQILSDYDVIPFDGYGAVNTILVNACHHFCSINYTEAERKIAYTLMELLVSLGFVLSERGIELPNPPAELFCSWGIRWIKPEQHRDLFPFISLAYAIATLPDSSFKFALEAFRYGFSVGIQKHDGNAFGKYDLQEALEILKQKSAFLHSNSLHFIRLKRKTDDELFDIEMKNVIDRGNKIVASIFEYLLVERKLYIEHSDKFKKN
jgi:hypothetical protein